MGIVDKRVLASAKISTTCARFLASKGLKRDIVQRSGYARRSGHFYLDFTKDGCLFPSTCLKVDLGRLKSAGLVKRKGCDRAFLTVRHKHLEFREQEEGWVEMLILRGHLPQTVLSVASGKPLSALVDLSSKELSWLSSPDLMIVACNNTSKRVPGGQGKLREGVELVLQDSWLIDNWELLPSYEIQQSARDGVALASVLQNPPVDALDPGPGLRVLDLPLKPYDPAAGDVLLDDVLSDDAQPIEYLHQPQQTLDLAGIPSQSLGIDSPPVHNNPFGRRLDDDDGDIPF